VTPTDICSAGNLSNDMAQIGKIASQKSVCHAYHSPVTDVLIGLVIKMCRLKRFIQSQHKDDADEIK